MARKFMCALRACVACGDAYLWVADPRQVTFLWSDKEKSPKEIRPGARDLLLRARGAPIRGAPVRRRGSPPDFHDHSASPSSHRALDQLAGCQIRASGSNTVSLNYSRWDCGTRRALRGFELPLSDRYAEVFSTPRMAHPSTVRLWACAPKGSRTGRCATGPRDRMSRWTSAGPQSRGAQDSAPSGRAFFRLPFFARAKKGNPGCRGRSTPQLAFQIVRVAHAQLIPVGQPPTSNTRAKPARQNNITPHPNPLPQGERGSRNGGATPQVHAAAGRTIA